VTSRGPAANHTDAEPQARGKDQAGAMSRADAILRSALVLGAIIWPPNAFLFTYALFEVAMLRWIAMIWMALGVILGVIGLVRWRHALAAAIFSRRPTGAAADRGGKSDP
jgi:hypothetical protein